MSIPVRSIKSLKPKTGKSSRYQQGYYNVANSTKYQNTKEPCIYRSSYEFKFIKWCEYSDLVKKWSSEPFSIQYLCMETGKTRHYWLDFTIVTVKDEHWLIEVKPNKEVQDAESFGRVYEKLQLASEQKKFIAAHKVAAKNWSKWKHAQREAEKKGWRFIIVTERFLQKYK